MTAGAPRPESVGSETLSAVRRFAVRDVADWVCRTGGLGRHAGLARPERALEGARIHRSLQRQRPAEYQAEVAVSIRRNRPSYVLEVNGRVDGVLRSPSELAVEEIKSVRHLPSDPDPLHLAQARLYAGMLAGTEPVVRIILTYCETGTGTLRTFGESHRPDQARAFLESTLETFAGWEDDWVAWTDSRNRSLRELGFPFDGFRAGQRQLAAAVYRTARDGGRLLVEAPTGSGKTAAVLFGALKALGEGRAERIFFLTAKTVGSRVAVQTLQRCNDAGAQLRWITLAARDKTCFCRTTDPCPVETCPFAASYYDRRHALLRPRLSRTGGSEWLPDVARAGGACPFELSLDAAMHSDVIIGDYNYFFDPHVGLERFFSGRTALPAIVLVDEAHNLPDRARDMLSAELHREPFAALQRELATPDPRLARACGHLARTLRKVTQCERNPANRRERPPDGRWKLVLGACPKPVLAALERFLKTAAEWLEGSHPAPCRDALRESWFEAFRFQRANERLGEAGVVLGGSNSLRLQAVDPSPHLHRCMQAVRSTILFSATLTPFDHYLAELGGLGTTLRLDCPFPPEHLSLFVAPRLRTSLRERERSLDAIADLIAAFATRHPGHHFVFFPSHAYLAAVAARFVARHPHLPSIRQTPGMSEEERARFLAGFDHPPPPGGVRLAFAILGGLFGEGIDLPEGRIAGITVVGPGLPQVSLEREQLRKRIGFEHAYRIPGMNRVIQAVGRLLRGPDDRGAALLIDERFARPEWRRLRPPHWRPRIITNPADFAGPIDT